MPKYKYPDPYSEWGRPSGQQPDDPPPPNNPPPPGNDPEPPRDGPTTPNDPPPSINIDPPNIDISLPDIDVGLPDINPNLPDVLDEIGVKIDADSGGIGGLLGGDGDGLSLLGINSDTDALIDLDAPTDLEASVDSGGGGSHLNLGGDGDLLNLGGQGDGLALLAIDGESDALINADLQDGEGIGAADLGNLINAAMLEIGGTSIIDALAQGDAYDGNVPLVGDLSSALGATLDHITTSSSLFDVPTLDILGLDALDS